MSLSAAQIIAMFREAAAEGLTEAAEYVLVEAREIAPDDPTTGGDDLSGSLTVDPAATGGLESKVYTNADHALYQHENLTLNHPTGQSKFLETAALKSRAEVERILREAVRRRLG